MRVKVTFYIEADEPEHELGVTTQTYEDITECVVNQLAGEDVEFEKEEVPA